MKGKGIVALAFLSFIYPFFLNSQTKKLETKKQTKQTIIEPKNIGNVDTVNNKNKKDTLWNKVNDGFYYGEFNAPIKSFLGNSKISVVKIDPKYYSFHLLCNSEQNFIGTAKQWAKEYNLIAVINAGMFRSNKRNAGYMVNFTHIDNGSINKKYNSFLVLNPVYSNLPDIQIVDKMTFNKLRLNEKYNTVIQNLRMIDEHQNNRWGQSKKKYSIAALAMDKQGNILLIHSRSPYSGHDFIKNILKLPLNVYDMMYLEGGPEASLYVHYKIIDKNSKNIEIEDMGSYETGFNEDDKNNGFWPIPNVIGIRKKN